MKPCVSCKTPVAAGAKNCPNCGQRDPHPSDQIIWGIGGLIFLACLVRWMIT